MDNNGNWKNHGFGVGVAIGDSDRVSERKLLGSLKRKEGFTNRKRGILSKEKRDSPIGKEELTRTVLST